MIAPEGFAKHRANEIVRAAIQEINRAPVTPYALIIAAMTIARSVRKSVEDMGLDADTLFREIAERLDEAEKAGEIQIKASLTLYEPNKEPPKE